MKREYGWIPDLPDQRDFLFSKISKPGVLPPSVDLRPTCSPVEDQGDLGSCTANALAGALEYLEGKDGVPYVDFSRMFIYYNERVIEGTVSQDSGAMIRDGIKSLAAQGVCSERLWPYNVGKFAVKPPAACYTEAAKHLINQYARIISLNDMKQCLSDGFPFVFGFTVYESFESQAVAKTGTVPMPKKQERALGGHAVLAVGYDDKTKRFIVRNSWGPNWGMKGYFTLPYDYLNNTNLADDMWTIRRGGLMTKRR